MVSNAKITLRHEAKEGPQHFIGLAVARGSCLLPTNEPPGEHASWGQLATYSVSEKS